MLARTFLLDFHVLQVEFYTLLTGVEETLFAIVKLFCFHSAKMALSLGLEFGKFQLMFVITGLQADRPALKAICNSIFWVTAVHASQLNNFLSLASRTDIVLIFRACHVHQDMVLLALHNYWPLFICSHSLAVCEAVSTNSSSTWVIIIVFLLISTTLHATELYLSLVEVWAPG